jgi:hypothetical protein
MLKRKDIRDNRGDRENAAGTFREEHGRYR